MRALAAAVLSTAAAALSGCDGGGGGCDCAPAERCIRGRCFAAEQPYQEPEAARATCPAPQQVAGGVIGPPQAPVGCGVPVRESAAVALRQALGTRTVGAQVQFQVPAGAASLTVILQAANPPGSGLPVPTVTFRNGATTVQGNNTAVPLRVVAPDQTVWFDDTAAIPDDVTGLRVFFGADAPAVGTLTIPNTTAGLQESAAGLPGGTWTLTVSDYAFECATIDAYQGLCRPAAGSAEAAAYVAGQYDVTVLVKPGPRPPAGTLDLALYLHACPGAEYDANGACCPDGALDTAGACAAAPLRFTSDLALTDPSAQRMLATIAGLAAGAGACLGTVTWYDLPDWAQQRWAAGLDLDAPTCEEGLGQVFALSVPPATGPAMNLFLLPDILDTSAGARVVGIDGTIPGPSTVPGTLQSGAIVSAANLRFQRFPGACGGGFSVDCGADATAYIAMHEAGHFLGLYHTTEADGRRFDPLVDTPECRCAACAAPAVQAQCGGGTAVVSGPSCLQARADCSGGRNLMFWLLERTSQGKVSPEQSEVIRSNPLVR
jgi:hypothetical protein